MIYIPFVSVNYLAVLVSALIILALGFAWYSPALFGKLWMKEVGLKKDSMKNPTLTFFLIPFFGALVMSYVLSHFVVYAGAKSAVAGAITGAWVGLGFVATTTLMNYLFANRSKELYLVDVGYHLASLIITGALLAAWM